MLTSRPIERRKEPQLFDVIERISAAADLPAPRVVGHERPYANSWVTGLRVKRTKLHLTRGLLNVLDEHQFTAVVAHEVAHVRQKDSALMSLVGTPMAGIADGAAFYFHRYGDMRHIWVNRMDVIPHGEPGVDASAEDIKDSVDLGASEVLGLWALAWLLLLPVGLLFLIVGSVCGVVTAVFSRARELEADAGAALLTGNPAALSSALIVLSDSPRELIPRKDLREAASLDVFHIVPMAKERLLLRTHPPLKCRLAQLASIEARLQHAEHD